MGLRAREHSRGPGRQEWLEASGCREHGRGPGRQERLGGSGCREHDRQAELTSGSC